MADVLLECIILKKISFSLKHFNSKQYVHEKKHVSWMDCVIKSKSKKLIDPIY